MEKVALRWLLDTTALSEPIRKRPSAAFLARLERTPPGELATSSICVMELRYGCALKGDPALWERIRKQVLSQVEVLPFGAEEAQRCGDVLAELSVRGRPVGIEDAQIAATALEHDLTVVTGNVRHFARVHGLRVEDWLAS